MRLNTNSMRDYYTVKVNLPAGIISPGALQTILGLAYEANVRRVRFGARQQLLMTVHYEDMRFFEKDLKKYQITYEINTDQYPNIISSYCGEEVFHTGSWLGETEYHTVLDSLDYQPRLKINLSDSDQSFTPFFTGNLNFIASTEPHFWYVYVRPRQRNLVFKWPDLIYTNQIGRLAKAIEAAMLDLGHQDEESLYRAVAGEQRYITLPATREVELPEFSLPYYEGFNRYGSRSWLGLYRRDEEFTIAFLQDICAMCLKTRIGEVCITPWKSLIIKGIEEKDRIAWSYILGKHNINVRHAANELAWQTEDHTSEGTRVKNYVIRYFQRRDTRTYGVCFGVQTRSKSEVFGSILIRKRPLIRLGSLVLFSVYDLYYTDNFNPNSRTHHLFEKGLYKLHLPGQIERLCRKFGSRRTNESTESARPEGLDVSAPEAGLVTVYQCPNCYTVYDEQYGDLLNDIEPGKPFQDLPDDYACPTCDTPKGALKPVDVERV